MGKMESLNGVHEGVYVVTTSGGTRHVVDLECGSVRRYGAPGRAWDHFSAPDGAADGEPFYFTRITNAAVGKRMLLFYKGGYLDSDLWRLTSEVASIATMDLGLVATQRAWGIDDSELASIIGVSTSDIELWKTGGVSAERRGRVVDMVMATEVISELSGALASEIVRSRFWGEESLLSRALGEDLVVLYALAMELVGGQGVGLGEAGPTAGEEL
jgi:hypothetical protein